MTLIELLIVVAISAIIMIALLELYMTGQKYFFNQNSRADTIEESRMPMAWVSRDIRGAQNIVSGPINAYNGIQYSSDANTLILEVPDIPNVGISYIIYDYDSTNHRLMRIVDQNTGGLENRTRVMADNLIDDGSGGSPFKLKYFQSNGTTEVTSGYADATNGAFIVEVELTAQGRAIQRGSRPFVETVRTQAKLRNKVIPVIPG
jgi:type II secretory pathway pseudopilin PulG